MHRVTKPISVIAALLLAASSSYARPAPQPQEDAGSIVITFKDGRQQSYSLADISRIEFNTLAADSATAKGRNRFLGRWKVGNGMGGSFYITLKANGEASKTIGASHGTWTVVNGEARISWDDGWHDAIRKVGRKYEKAAFKPGTSFNDAPSNVTEAENTQPKPL
jgi:hypothetical protein